ncbi:hypothetical protein GC173_06625 [bacterium]|nr:hypothetical protein [bacterium]
MKRPLAGVAVVGFLVVAGLAYYSMQPKSGGSTDTAVRDGGHSIAKAPAKNISTAPVSPAVDEVPAKTMTPEESEKRMIEIGAEQVYPTPTPDIPGDIDPESQPRKFMTESFQGLASTPEGFELTGVVLTPDGFTIDPDVKAVDGIREGVLVSPSKPTDFPSNAFAPMWKEVLPGGTNMAVEFQLSPDGENWSEWTAAGVDTESMRDRSDTMPDGSRNPNADYVLGGLHAWPDEQWTHVRYRVTMQSQSEESPVLEGFRIYIMDSTLGEGRLADISTAGPAAPVP